MKTVNPILHLLAQFGNGLTAYQFAYKGENPHGDETRFDAAARIASNPYGVIPFDTPGYFSVMSDDPRQPERRYGVCALPGELACDCPDGTHSKHNKSGLCKHTLSALMRYAVEEA